MPVDSKEYANKETDYKKMNDHEISNKDIIPDVNKLLKKINYRSSFDDRIIDEEKMPMDYSNEVSSEKELDFFDNKILDNKEILDILDNNKILVDYNNEVPKEESDKVVDKALDIKQILPVNGEFASYFKNINKNIVKAAPIVILYNKYNVNILSSSISIFICEILNKYQGHWKLKSIKYSYKHPSEFAALKILETKLPIYKFFKNAKKHANKKISTNNSNKKGCKKQAVVSPSDDFNNLLNNTTISQSTSTKRGHKKKQQEEIIASLPLNY
ncbi:10791_t:CDS:2, partial [Dentiscutata heterogama]